jgi:hypothetical protein
MTRSGRHPSVSQAKSRRRWAIGSRVASTWCRCGRANTCRRGDVPEKRRQAHARQGSVRRRDCDREQGGAAARRVIFRPIENGLASLAVKFAADLRGIVRLLGTVTVHA